MGAVACVAVKVRQNCEHSRSGFKVSMNWLHLSSPVMVVGGGKLLGTVACPPHDLLPQLAGDLAAEP
jgi:hypothetical protein